jgi:hypothetical protein
MEMGKPELLADHFFQVYKPKLFAKIAWGLVTVLLLASAGSILYVNFRTQKRWDLVSLKAAHAHERVVHDVEVLEQLPIFKQSLKNALTSPLTTNDAGTYLNPLLRNGKEAKDFDLARLESFDHWEGTTANPEGRYPNIIYFYDYVKLNLPKMQQHPLSTLRLYRKTAELFYSVEMTMSSLIAIELLQQERKTYEAFVRAGKLRPSEWDPLSEETLTSASHGVRAANAYYKIFSGNLPIPHPEKLCSAIGQGVSMVSHVRPLLNGHFPLESNYASDLERIDELLEQSIPYCRLDYARSMWARSKEEWIDKDLSKSSFISPSLWYAMRIAPGIPYLRRILAKYFAYQFVSANTFRDYEMKGDAPLTPIMRDPQ